MVEPPEKGERATLNSNLSTRLNLLFSDQALARRVGYCWSRRASKPRLIFNDFEIVQQDHVRRPSPTNRAVSGGSEILSMRRRSRPSHGEDLAATNESTSQSI